MTRALGPEAVGNLFQDAVFEYDCFNLVMATANRIHAEHRRRRLQVAGGAILERCLPPRGPPSPACGPKWPGPWMKGSGSRFLTAGCVAGGTALRRSRRGHDVQPSIAVHIGSFQGPAALVASVRKLQELALDNRGTSFRRSTPYHVNTSRPPLALAPTAAPDEVVGAHASAMPSRNSDAGPIARAEECASG
jgi:hypothetical protein